ncbi:MAG: tRNA 2-thiouridine(34) synthase MnmA [Lachnospiraceae bacterium]|nr:tRNA 2-thiouridine(34) synthase MnmA [Lachnospiraceae bacterium]
MKEKVIVGLSGGVDSSVAVHLLKEQGYECIGVTMRVWQPKTEEAFNVIKKAEADAVDVAKHFGIEHHMVDFCDKFDYDIMRYFTEEYLAGRTPNPCTICNNRVKWDALMSAAKLYGADKVATGHYARVIKLPSGRYSLMTTPTAVKDQTYALYRLTQEQLAKTIMPVGEYTKDEIRKMAVESGISVADKPDSQEICFIPDNDYASFIKQYTGKSVDAGNFVDMQGKVIGQHIGIIHYTVGQRKGLGIALGQPAFVVDIKPDTNEVVIGTNEDVFSDVLYADSVNYMGIADIPEEGLMLTAKIRYAHKGARCVVTKTADGGIKCEFTEPQRAITPGQSVVLYKDNYIALGGIIKKTR